MSTAAPTGLRPPPQPPWITKKVDLFQLAGTAVDPRAELAAASKIWGQCYIAFEPASITVADEARTRQLLDPGGTTPLRELTVIVNPDEPTQGVRRLREMWFNQRRSSLAVVFAPRVRLTTNGAPSAADPEYDIVYIGVRQYWAGWEVAHELGHRLIGADLPHNVLESPLMHPNNPGNEIVNRECRAARGDAAALYEIIRRSQNR